MGAVFHLSLPVPDVDRSVEFFTSLGGTVTHRDPSGYVNLDLAGVQLTLQPGVPVSNDVFHFGLNVERSELDAIAARLSATVLVVDEGTPMERAKIYVRCPAGYLIELKALKRLTPT